MKNKISNGYSLVEVITVAAIIGIIGGVTIASFYSNYEREKIRSANRILSSWLDDQRRKAIQNSAPCEITISISDATAESNCGSGIATEDINLRSEINEDDLRLENIVPGSSSTITWYFTPRGTTTSAVELRLSLDDSDAREQCLSLSALLGLIRQGSLISGACNYTTIY